MFVQLFRQQVRARDRLIRETPAVFWQVDNKALSKLPHLGSNQHICNERVEVATREQKNWQSRGRRGLDIACSVTDHKARCTGQCSIRSWIMPGLGFRQWWSSR
jgi:hypothetical protein